MDPVSILSFWIYLPAFPEAWRGHVDCGSKHGFKSQMDQQR